MRAIIAAALAAVALPAAAQDQAPAGTQADRDYAALLWDVMTAEGLAGAGRIQALPYPGIAPHGLMLETFYTRAQVDGRSGTLVVKRNYGPEGVTEDEVLADPAGHLGSVTVMFRRAEGYAPEAGDWFWAKYLPDGTLDTNPAGMALAGRVGLGGEQGCIPCHAQAGGDDWLYTTDAALD
jgi:hypothetical protein